MNIGPKIQTGTSNKPASSPPKSTTRHTSNPASAESEAPPAGSAVADAASLEAIRISPAETPAPSVSITSLREAIKVVNAQNSLSTEDLFKTLLVYHKPNQSWLAPVQGWSATVREPQFLATAINKESSHGIVSDETQKEIASAIRSEQFGTQIPENVALAIAAKLGTFTAPEAQGSIAVAISEGRFGNPIPQAVALAIATNLGTFTAPEAQGSISNAIRLRRFGDPIIPQDVALALVSNLGTFKDLGAQKNISKFIATGTFGAERRPEVALTTEGNPDTFTAPAAQRTISEVMDAGTFGAERRPEVALTTEGNPDTFTDSAAQENISGAIASEQFGNPTIPPNVALAIAAELGTFTAPPAPPASPHPKSPTRTSQARSEARPAWSDKPYPAMRQSIVIIPRIPRSPATPPPSAKITSLREAIKVVNAQSRLSTEDLFKTLLVYHKPDQGRFSTPRELNFLTVAIDKKVPYSHWPVSKKTQLNMSKAIYSGTFGTPIPPNVALAIATELDTFTDPEAQQIISAAIFEGKFGDPRIPEYENVAFIIAAKLDTFKSPAAQRNIAAAIHNKIFGNPMSPNVALSIVSDLATFTDPQAQRSISKAIFHGRFGTPIPPEVARIIVSEVDTFTDPAAQRNSSNSIFGWIFGESIPQDVARAPVSKLGRFTDLVAQRNIAAAIFQGEFGDPRIPENVALDIAATLDKLTDPEAQQNIFAAICAGKFGTPMPPNVAVAIATKLGTFTDSAAQENIAMAIYNGQFEKDPELLKALADHLPVFTNSNAKRNLSAAICKGSFGVDPGVLKTLYRRNMVSFKALTTSTMGTKALYPEFKFNRIPQKDLKNSLSYSSFFGAKRYTSSEVETALKDKFKDMADEAPEVMCENGSKYAFQIYGDYSVLCRIDAESVSAESVSEASFQGWITSEYSYLYKGTLEKVAVYNCSVLTEGYPSKMEVSKTHVDFNALPMYLMEAIRQNSFDSSTFTHHATIAFVASTILDPIVQKNPDLGNKMKGIIQQAISNKGRDVSIASTRAEDGKIKDAINALCADVATIHNFEDSVMTHFKSLGNDPDKARLAYLLGQIAKAGVLGYHHGDKNQANDLFYSLSKKCFDELAYSREMVFPAGFHANLAGGNCISAVTSSFRTSNSWVHDIFEKN